MTEKKIEQNMKNNSFDLLIDQINAAAGHVQRERGTLFEKLVVAYLKNEPTYKNLYTDVWMLNDVPEQYGIPNKDTGVDIVARDENGELTAVQAKFYEGKVGKAEINSFIAELGKKQYSKGLIISTTDEWNVNAQKTIEEQSKDVQIIGLADLRNSQIDWTQFSFSHIDKVVVKSKKQTRGYQRDAIQLTIDHFKDHDRGQLIMAPGTGKTFTSLKLAEELSKNAKQNQYRVLYMVPSIQLLTQTLRGWNNDLDDDLTMTSMAVTSDRNASRGQREDNEDIKPDDIGFPATTSTSQILKNWKEIQDHDLKDLLVVFSTYQSIDVISQAQKNGFPEFDLIIADEAHKTTGAKALGDEFSPFTKVHDNTIVTGKKRLYQTATPKLYGPEAKAKATEQSIVVSSMDDVDMYGEVIYRLGFGDAVSEGILTDYKLMVLAVDESTVQKDMQSVIADPENGLNIDDVGRIIGVWNAMMKRHGYPRPNMFDGAPMRRAIAFTSVIDSEKTKRDGVGSKQFANDFEWVINEYLGDDSDDHMTVKVKHADGSMNALQKSNVLSWLADENLPDDEARIVSNVKFLTEGIDVPTLDSVIFLAPKRSQVDIVQAIGRIMRKSANKEYGYIILPIVVPAGVKPESILDNNKKYDVIWQVMNALRSVDERFEATINKLQLNKKKPANISVVGVGGAPNHTNSIGSATTDDDDIEGLAEPTQSYAVQGSFDLQWNEMREAIYGKIVQKVGDRKYLEDWSKDVAIIAQRYIDWIDLKLQEKNNPIAFEFNKFVKSLQHNINDSIDQTEATGMLAQHLITKPVFEALFNEYSFVNDNPVSRAMESIVSELEKAGFAKETKELEPFYNSVRLRAEGIDNAAAKQQIIVTLYNKFFKTAFQSTTKRLGIVFTPVEIVDFIVKSVDYVLHEHFNKSLASEGVHILDPFTGTGTFIVQTLTFLKQQMDAGEITLADITRKFTQELHANEIILLSYYIAAINIEATFDEINGTELGYVPFSGIVLTDTFESTENEVTLDDTYLGMNNQRLIQQQKDPITVIIGNPPYSGRDEDENDFSESIVYPKLDAEITKSYAKNSRAIAVNALYDSYIRALKWSSLRIGETGVIGFITSNSYIDKIAMDGLRRSLNDEFNQIYVINLRGAIRGKVGKIAKDEGGNVFDIMTGVAIILLVKDSSGEKKIYYKDIGTRLTKNKKIDLLKSWESIENINFEEIIPDQFNDWINHRDLRFDDFDTLSGKDEGVYNYRQMGITTKRDKWVYGFSKKQILKNVTKTIAEYENVRESIANNRLSMERVLSNETNIQWSRELKRKLSNNIKIELDKSNFITALYRPFTKKYLYYDKNLVSYPGKFKDQLSIEEKIYLMSPGTGNRRDFSVLVSKDIPDGNIFDAGAQTYSSHLRDEFGVFSNISDTYKKKVGLDEKKTLAYIYAVLNSPEYRKRFKSNLGKETPRIPMLKNKEKYIEIGEQLINLHVNYENVPSYESVVVDIKSDTPNYEVKKMRHPKIRNKDGKSVDNRTIIIFNKDITISNIPEKAYDYVINGKSAIDWIMDQYRIKNPDKSGIIDDPNEYSENPKYILNLLLSIITVSMKTLELVGELPEFELIE